MDKIVEVNREPFMIPQNGMRFENVMNAISMFDCIRVEYWKEVNIFFKNKLLTNEETNKTITSILKKLFWFGVSNDMFCDDAPLKGSGYHMIYNVVDDKTIYLRISLNDEILWELKA